MELQRYHENPLITPADVKPSRPDFEVIGAFNAGVAEFNGEVLLLLRVAERPICDDIVVRVPVLRMQEGGAYIELEEYRRDYPGIDLHDPRVVSFPDRLLLTSISHLRLARSKDGRNFEVEETPAIAPDRPSEAFGIEDPRITQIGDTYYIVYKGVSGNGIVQSLATTKDFVTYNKEGIMLCPENMDSMIFPEKVRGQYVAIHRPVGAMLGGPMMWLAYGTDPLHWGEHHFLLGKTGDGWDSGRVGGGAVPFLTEQGWLEIYHAATPEHHYCLGAMLLDREHPEKVLAKTSEPIMRPEAPYETGGFMPNVVFTCGLIQRGDILSVYYGAADEVMAGVDMKLQDVMDALRPV